MIGNPEQRRLGCIKIALPNIGLGYQKPGLPCLMGTGILTAHIGKRLFEAYLIPRSGSRIDRIEGELSQLLETLDINREQAREARSRLENAVNSMGDLESTRQALAQVEEAASAAESLNVQAAKLGVETRKAAYMPRVDFRVRQSWDRNLDGVKGGSRDAAVELLLNYNLYRGGADKAREVQAAEFQNEARNLQEKACRDARQTLAIAYNDVVRLTEQLGYLDQHRLSTEKAREAYRQQFDIGQRTLLDLLDTQNEYFEAGRAYTNAYYNHFVAQARTLSGMGKLVPALNVARPDMPTPKDVGQDRDGMDPSELCPFDTPDVLMIDKTKAVADAPQRARPAPAPAAPAAAAAAPAARTTFAADALFDLLSRHDVPVAPVVEPARLAALPQFATRDKFEAGDHMPLVRFPVPLAGMSEGVLGPVPALGSARI